MSNQENVFKSRYMLLVSDDKLRVQVLTQALREREANVGDLRLPLRDRGALSGVELVLVDVQHGPTMQAQVREYQADLRSRWASVCTLDFRTIVAENGGTHLSVLEALIAPLMAPDRALTEQAQRGTPFVTELSPLGPKRTLRALVRSGATLEAEISLPGTPETKASVTLSNELIVCAFLERGGERHEAWKALACILELPDGQVRVAPVSHPATMNIMEPLDLALRNAEQLLQPDATELARDDGQASAAAGPIIAPVQTTSPPPRVHAPPAPSAFSQPAGRTMIGIGPSARAPAKAPSTTQPALPEVPSTPDASSESFADMPTKAAPYKLTSAPSEPPAADESSAPELDLEQFLEPASPELSSDADELATAPAPALEDSSSGPIDLAAAPPRASREPAMETGGDELHEGQAFVELASPTELHAIDQRVPRRVRFAAGVSAVLAILVVLGVGYTFWARPEPTAPPSAAAQPSTRPTAAVAEATPTTTPEHAAPTAEPAAAEGAPQPAATPEHAAPQAEPASAQEGVVPPPPALEVDESEPQVPMPPAEAARAPAGEAAPTASPDDLIRDATRSLGRDPEGARRLFASAVALAPKNPHAQAGLGQALLELHQPAAAQKALEVAIRLRPKRARYRVLLGDALKMNGKLEQARAAWQKALELDPADADARKRLGA